MKLWRYMPLSHYVNMVASSKLYVPLTSKLSDSMEGTWFSNTESHLIKNQIPYLENRIQLFEKCGSLNEPDFREFCHEYLQEVYEQFELDGHGPVKQYLENVIAFSEVKSYFQKEAVNSLGIIRLIKRELSNNSANLELIKERTFVSSWSKSNEQNLALWKLFGHGDDTVAITTTFEKMEKVIRINSTMLNEMGFDAKVTEVLYIDKIHQASEENLNKMVEIMEKVGLEHIASLMVKPKPYFYENETRLIIFPIKNPIDIRPEYVELEINLKHGQDRAHLEWECEPFIDEIYLPPNLTLDSPQYKAVAAINKKFGIDIFPLKIDRIEISDAYRITR